MDGGWLEDISKAAVIELIVYVHREVEDGAAEGRGTIKIDVLY